METCSQGCSEESKKLCPTTAKEGSQRARASRAAHKEEADRKKILEEAKKIVIEEDMGLPKAERIKLDVTNLKKVKLGNGTDVRGTRVQVFGRVHRERR